MKREELTPIELECNMGTDVNGVVQREPWKAYDIDEVDHLLDEKDAEIEDLLRQNRELCQALQVMYSKEEYGKLQKEIESLKAKLETVNELVKTSKDLYDHAVESLKASHYAEMVDAGMRERRLLRALWKERADNAGRIECMFRALSNIEEDDTRTYWIFGNKWESVLYHLKCHRMKTAYDWTMIWKNIERKCRAMAEKWR